MSSKKIVFHIGARKSGSTTIQKKLAKNNEVLHEYGCHYLESARMPKKRGDGHYAHYRAARPIENSECWDQIAKEINKTEYKKYVISSETFYEIDTKKIRSIKKYLEKAGVENIDIIMVKRNPIGFILSEYKQQIKITKECRGIIEFARENIEKCRHDEAVERWVSALNTDRSVVLHLSDFMGDNSLIRKICQLLDVPDHLFEEERMNTSLSDERTAVLRVFNKLTTQVNVYGKSKFVRQLKNSLKRGGPIGRTAEKMLKPFTSGQLYDDRELKQLKELLKRQGLAAS
jgi:hypothetical protein